MNDKYLHSNYLNDSWFFQSGSFCWTQSDAAVWENIAVKIGEKKALKVSRPVRKLWVYAIAASLTLLTGTAAFFLFYAKTFQNLSGQHLTVSLPDGSSVQMNAVSTLKYYPGRWLFRRNVNFEGEGYFSVTKGRDFRVHSANGMTQVLGTDFNIFSRDDVYHVTCFTGSVSVEGNSNKSAILKPGDRAEIDREGNIRILKNYNLEKVEAWRLNQFNFTATPLKDVVSEIERQYGVKIEFQKEFYLNYSGNFSKMPTVEEVLVVVCRPLNINFVKKSEKNYLIFENE